MSPVLAVVVARTPTGRWHNRQRTIATELLLRLTHITSVGGVLAALDRLSARPAHIRRLRALVAGHKVELDLLAVTDAAQVLVRIVARDRRLVDEYVLLGVVAVDEAVAILHIEPLHRADDIFKNHLRHTTLHSSLMSDRVTIAHRNWKGRSTACQNNVSIQSLLSLNLPNLSTPTQMINLSRS